MNKVMFTGRLTNNVEIRVTKTNKYIASGCIAINDRFKKDEADFFRFQAWERLAELLEKYTEKGARVTLLGRMKNNEYKNNEGETVRNIYLLVEEVNLIDFKKDSDTSKTSNENKKESNGFYPVDHDAEEDLPF